VAFPTGGPTIVTIDIDPVHPSRFYAGTKGHSFHVYPRTDIAVEVDYFLSGPTHYSLSQNYPNPFNPNTTICYAIRRGGDWESMNGPVTTTLKIYNVLGQQVKTLVNELKEIGNYSVVWDGRDDHDRRVASGIYLYQLTVDGGRWSKTKRMILLR